MKFLLILLPTLLKSNIIIITISPHKRPGATGTGQLMEELSPSRERGGSGRWEIAFPLCKLKDSLLISSNECRDSISHLLVRSTLALVILLKLPPDSEQSKSWNRGNLFNQ